MSTQARLDREKYGPGIVEVTVGAAISVVLGAALAALWLLFKPVEIVRELPPEDERVAGQVYFVEGSRDTAKGRSWMRKRQLLAETGSDTIPLVEEELNAWAAEGKTPSDQAAPTQFIVPAAVNFRIRDGVFQVGVPSTVNLLGYSRPVVFQARGKFVSEGDGVVFSPDEFYAGSLAAGRVPIIGGILASRLSSAGGMPSELGEAWGRVTSATIDGATLQLSMR